MDFGPVAFRQLRFFHLRILATLALENSHCESGMLSTCNVYRVGDRIGHVPACQFYGSGLSRRFRSRVVPKFAQRNAARICLTLWPALLSSGCATRKL